MTGGWIKLYRKFLEWEWFTDPKMVQVFVYLLLSASIEDRKWKGIVLRRGQLATTYPELAERTSLSVRNLRTALQRLEESQIIDRQTTNKYTLITICTYESYQSNEDAERQTNDSPATDKRQTNDRQTTGNIAKEGEEVIKSAEVLNTTTTTESFKNLNACAPARESFSFRSLTREEQRRERAAFFSVFYWANVWKPAAELRKFIKHNESFGWASKCGTVFGAPAQRLALAEKWVEDDRCAKGRDRYIGALRAVYDALTPLRPDLASLCVNEACGIEDNGRSIVFHYPAQVCAFLEKDEVGRAIVRETVKPGVKISFSDKPITR